MTLKIRELPLPWWPFPSRVAAITLYPFILYNAEHKMFKDSRVTLRQHEWWHIDQVRKHGWFNFYFNYVTVKGFRNAVERDAYRNQLVHRDEFI